MAAQLVKFAGGAIHKLFPLPTTAEPAPTPENREEAVAKSAPPQPPAPPPRTDTVWRAQCAQLSARVAELEAQVEAQKRDEEHADNEAHEQAPGEQEDEEASDSDAEEDTTHRQSEDDEQL